MVVAIAADPVMLQTSPLFSAGLAAISGLLKHIQPSTAPARQSLANSASIRVHPPVPRHVPSSSERSGEISPTQPGMAEGMGWSLGKIMLAT